MKHSSSLTRESAKMILAVYPTGEGGARDDFFTAALALMEEDSELCAWFEREQECKAALSEKIAEIEPPSDLRATILAGAQASRCTNSGWRPRRKFLAAAAILVLAATGSWAWLTRSYTGGGDIQHRPFGRI